MWTDGASFFENLCTDMARSTRLCLLPLQLGHALQKKGTLAARVCHVGYSAFVVFETPPRFTEYNEPSGYTRLYVFSPRLFF
ncbi:unnamed protein product [Caenorhabditis auriculariae]|uniref:Uncharacterized protein n=1 Tax=Caenorhabditis auriculariae TaxID=2777116 RepID=A0A8S1GP44_9PELO|nr:unnamed protein product [Caenorhabditis auriculariae]